MKVGEQGFSTQYLKQAHDEWLYVQAAREGRSRSPEAQSPQDDSSYSFRVQVTPDRQVHWLEA